MSGAYEELEHQLDQEEQAVGQREAQLRESESALEADILGIEGRCRAVQKKIYSLMDSGQNQAAQLLKQLPRLGPTPGIADRHRSLQARQVALEQREQAADSREQALYFLDLQIKEAHRLLIETSQHASRLEQSPSFVEPSPTPSKDLGERRVEDRRQVNSRVTLSSRDNFFTGFVRNVSQGGLFISTFDLQPVGSDLELKLKLPGGIDIDSKVIVRWLRPLNKEEPDAWPGMGVEFLNLDSEARRAVNLFMEIREPIFYTD